MNTNPSTLDQLTEARDLMQHMIVNGFSWQMRASQERHINQLREKLQAENARKATDLHLLEQIFTK